MSKYIKTLNLSRILRFLLILSTLMAAHSPVSAQTPASGHEQLSTIIKNHYKTFRLEEGKFVGDGWTELLEKTKTHNNVLIGEDHFFNEIPLFVSKILEENSFDNFFCEIDPISAKLIEKQLKTSSGKALESFVKNYGSTFSFFALTPELNLLKQLVAADTKVFGTDQVVLMADRLISATLKELTSNATAKNIYEAIELQSKKDFEQFTAGKGEPYFFSDSFSEQLGRLEALNLSETEQTAIKAMKLSRKIYLERNHRLRIQLMKHNLLQEFERIQGSKNLYKYGAIHAGKGESLLGGYDIGNVVHNIAESQFEGSLHIMIIGKNGMQGGSFKGDPSKELNPEKGPLKSLMPFFEVVEGDQNWYVFNTNDIVKAAKQQKVNIENKTLSILLSNYDYLVVIPMVSAASFVH